MNRQFESYRFLGLRTVQGWLRKEALTIFEVIDSVQRENQIHGAVAEIGVHHGKLLIALQLLKRPAENSVAIDVFGDQHLNVDQSGKGDYDIFVANVERWGNSDGLVVHHGDSTHLDAKQLLELAGAPIRLFSVDGGHTQQIVMSDMRLAEATLADGGVVIVDDVFNEEWPDVGVGTLKYLDEGARLAPFLVGFNKVLFADAQHCETYRSAVEAVFSDRRRVTVKRTIYAGHDVTTVLRMPPTPRQVLRRSQLARSIYHRVRKR